MLADEGGAARHEESQRALRMREQLVQPARPRSAIVIHHNCLLS